MDRSINFNYGFPTDIRFGRGVIARDNELLKMGKRAYIVTGRHSARSCGALGDCITALDKLGVSYRLCEQVKNNPNVEQCREIGRDARQFKADFVIGIGGGSPMDASKAVAVFGANDISCERLFNYGYDNGILPIAAIPTTSGSGSEVTPWSVLTRDDMRTKRSFGGKDTFPKIAFLDPAYTDNLPDDITINTATDAFTHCFESLISLRANPFTDAVNLYALKLFAKCMERLERRIFQEIRDELMLVSMMGGTTISQTGTTVMHAMGYPLTYFHNIPHGAANAYILPVYLDTVAMYRSDKLNLGLNAMGVSADELKQFSATMFTKAPTLSADDIRFYAEQTLNQGSTKNTGIPCEFSDIENMYKVFKDR